MNKIKYFIIATAIFLANSAIAAQFEVDAVVVKVVPQYSEIRVNTPIRTCNIVEVPIYGNTGKAQTGEVLGGAIIGGILGYQVGGGKGKDAATILGAILGADFANKKGGQQTIVGYKQVEQCEVTYEKTYQTITKCDVTLSIPAIKGVTHSYVADTCPANNTRVKLVTSLSIQRR
jgi:uncharacterized protein YcfJ